MPPTAPHGRLRGSASAYPNVAALPPSSREAPTQPVLSVQLDSPAGPLSLFTTLTSFGTPQDITLDELVIELFYPADETTAQALQRRLAGA